jgi:hypothetical protein
MPAAGIQRRAAGRRTGLISAGLLIVNPPWTLGELKAILPELEKPLGQGGAGRFRLERPKPKPDLAFARAKADLSGRQFAGNRIMLGHWDWLYVPLPRMVAAE